MPKLPTVSVICITYNQEVYIRQALEGFVAQKRDKYNLEIIVADDGSTDGTQGIIREFATRYPQLFKPILRTQNIGAWTNFLDGLNSSNGEYIALCEGDDYWTDDHKLQKQVTYMENNPDYALCFHRVKVVYENDEKRDEIFPQHTSGFTVKNLLQGNFIQTNSVMYRRQDYASLIPNAMPGDWYLHLFHAQFGKIGFLDETMAVYRRHAGGLWWDLQKDPYELWKDRGVSYMVLYAEFMKMYGDKAAYRDIIQQSVVAMYNRLLTVDQKFGTHKVIEATQAAPTLGGEFIRLQNASITQQNDAIRRLLTELSRANEELHNVRTSRSFVVGHMLLHPWLAPRRLAGIMKRGVIRLTIWVRRRQKARKVLHEYKAVTRTILRHKTTENNQIAVILHLYYTDMWPYFRDRLRQLDGQGFDLYVSVAYGKESVAEEIKKTYPEVCVYGTPNHGRDVLPFLQTLQAISNKKYAYVLKLHSKKSKHRDDGNAWFTSIIEHLIPSEKIGMESLMDVLQKDDTGVIGPAGEYMTLPVNYEGNKFHVRRLLGKLTSHKTVEKVDANRFDYGFFAGTMFWARRDAIEPALHVRRRIDDFALERGQIDGTVAHAYERIFCLLPELQGKSIYEIGENQIQQIPYKTDYAPEWSDVYEPISTQQS